MRTTKYDAERLAPVVQSSRTLGEVIRKLGLPPTGGNYRHISMCLRRAGVDVSQLRKSTAAARCAAVPRETLEALVARSVSVAQVLTALGMPNEGRCHREMSLRIRTLSIDTTHFRGSSWSRGETAASHATLKRISTERAHADSVVFIESSSHTNGKRITQRLLALGWSYRCAICNIAEWCERPLVLHLDHINGVHNDNRIENLRLLCPNCHSQTETYCRRNHSAGA